MPAGAPSKITPELLEKAKQFVDGGWKKHNKAVPTIEALAIELDLARAYLYEVDELSDTLESIQRMQANIALEKGLLGEYNSNIVKLLLSSKHGYVEKSASEQTIQADVTSNGETVASTELAAGFAQYLKAQTEQK